MKSKTLDQLSTTHSQLRSIIPIRNKLMFLDQDNIPQHLLLIKMENTSMLDTKTAVSEILEEFLEDVRQHRINYQDLELTMFLCIKIFLLRENTAFQVHKTVWQEVLEVLKEVM